MGWAARAKQRQGNPEPARLKARFIRNDKHEEAVLKNGRGSLLDFSDRMYVMDAKGTLRRVPDAQRAQLHEARTRARLQRDIVPS